MDRIKNELKNSFNKIGESNYNKGLIILDKQSREKKKIMSSTGKFGGSLINYDANKDIIKLGFSVKDLKNLANYERRFDNIFEYTSYPDDIIKLFPLSLQQYLKNKKKELLKESKNPEIKCDIFSYTLYINYVKKQAKINYNFIFKQLQLINKHIPNKDISDKNINTYIKYINTIFEIGYNNSINFGESKILNILNISINKIIKYKKTNLLHPKFPILINKVTTLLELGDKNKVLIFNQLFYKELENFVNLLDIDYNKQLTINYYTPLFHIKDFKPIFLCPKERKENFIKNLEYNIESNSFIKQNIILKTYLNNEVSKFKEAKLKEITKK